MVEHDYDRAKEAAVKELESLLETRQKTEQRILQLKKTIAALDALSGSNNSRPTPKLTEAMRSIFRAMPKNHVMSAGAVRSKLFEMGFNEREYSNFLASVHVALKRLVEKGEIRRMDTSEGVFYKPVVEDFLAELG